MQRIVPQALSPWFQKLHLSRILFARLHYYYHRPLRRSVQRSVRYSATKHVSSFIPIATRLQEQKTALLCAHVDTFS